MSKSGNFGHQVNSEIPLQTLEIQMRRLLMSRLIWIFIVCLDIWFFIPIIKIWNNQSRCPNLADRPIFPDFTLSLAYYLKRSTIYRSASLWLDSSSTQVWSSSVPPCLPSPGLIVLGKTTKNSKWVWSGNTTIKNFRLTHGTARKSHTTITRRQEDKLSKETSPLFPIKMIAKLEGT